MMVFMKTPLEKRIEIADYSLNHSYKETCDHLNFSKITILDPHSLIATQNISRAEAIYPIERIEEVVRLTDSKMICFPDEGSRRKYFHSNFFVPYLIAEKKREQDGKIIEQRLSKYDRERVQGNILICDDIIDGGATFIGLTKILKEHGALEVNLFATYGLFSKGKQCLFDAGIKRIFTYYEEILP